MRGLMAMPSITNGGWVHSTAFRLWLLSAAGVLATALTAWSAARSPTFVDPVALAVWRSVIIAAYWAVGVYTWWRRPESRLGRVITTLAVLYAGQALVGSPVALVYTLGMVVWAASIVYTAYLFLCFPAGRLESALERWFIRIYWLSTAIVWTLILAIAPALPAGGSFVSCGTRCPRNALQIVDGHAATGAALSTIFQILFTVALIGVATLIVSKARSSAAARRRAIVPLAVAFLADIVQFVVALFLLPSYPGTAGALKVADGVVTLAVPVAILLNSTPFKNPSGLSPFDARLSPSGDTLWVVDDGGKSISAFAVNGGSLTELPSSPTALPANSAPFGIVVL